MSVSSDLSGQEIGYRGATACVAAGITYRQLDYWARTGLVEPSVQSATGSGSQRFKDRKTFARHRCLTSKHTYCRRTSSQDRCL